MRAILDYFSLFFLFNSLTVDSNSYPPLFFLLPFFFFSSFANPRGLPRAAAVQSPCYLCRPPSPHTTWDKANSPLSPPFKQKGEKKKKKKRSGGTRKKNRLLFPRSYAAAGNVLHSGAAGLRLTGEVRFGLAMLHSFHPRARKGNRPGPEQSSGSAPRSTGMAPAAQPSAAGPSGPCGA